MVLPTTAEKVVSEQFVVVPFVADSLHPETREWAANSGAILYELSSSDAAYWEALTEWWQQPGDLVIVEQDIVPHPDVVAEMLGCPSGWCSSPFLVRAAPRMRLWITHDGVTSVRPPLATPDRWLTDGLGCVKFSAALRQEFPEAAVSVEGPWWRLDTHLSQLLRGYGLVPHLHEKSVHLHDYSVRRSPPRMVPIGRVASSFERGGLGGEDAG
jgi:hypothetical protein